jgi:hypothetical protein
MADGHEMADKDEDTTVQNVTAMADCETEEEEEEEREGVSNGRSNIIGHSDSEIMLTKCSEYLEVQNEAVARQSSPHGVPMVS